MVHSDGRLFVPGISLSVLSEDAFVNDLIVSLTSHITVVSLNQLQTQRRVKQFCGYQMIYQNSMEETHNVFKGSVH